MSGIRVRMVMLGSAVALAAGMVVPTVAFAAPARPLQTLHWVALGDSYTAGVIQATGDVTENPPDGCARTVESYPEIIRRDLGSLVTLRNVSCGAATIDNVYREEQTPLGRPLPPDGTDPDAPFAPVPVQLNALAPNADLVTVGVGGNTIGFGPILLRCLALGAETGNTGTPCANEFTASLPVRLETVRTEYDQMLSAIHAKAPFAKVITVGYPHVMPNNVTGCTFRNTLQFGTITFGDLDWARASVLEPLNAIIEQVTAAHGDKYVDLYSSSNGHSVCDRTGTDNWTDGLFTSLFPLRFAYVHPNARGQANAAAQVEDAILAG